MGKFKKGLCLTIFGAISILCIFGGGVPGAVGYLGVGTVVVICWNEFLNWVFGISNSKDSTTQY